MSARRIAPAKRATMAPGERIIVFPAHARLALIEDVARNMAIQKAEQAERYLADLAKAHAAGLRRRGVPDKAAEEDAQRFAGAVRATLWRLVLLNGGRAS